MKAHTVLPAPAGLRGIIICEETKLYWFAPVVAMVVEETQELGYFELSYITAGGSVACNAIDSLGFVHGVITECAGTPLAQWEVENKLTLAGGAAV